VPLHFRGGRREVPLAPLPITGSSWEAAARSTAERVLEPAGLEVTAIARTPYLSAGDAAYPLHVLDAAIFVCGRGSVASGGGAVR
jgi:hypothetical protein